MLQLEELLPQRVTDQYQMTAAMWQDRITTWWQNNAGMSRYECNFTLFYEKFRNL